MSQANNLAEILKKESVKLSKRLNAFTDIEKYPESSVSRVVDFIEECKTRGKKGRPYSVFTSIEDYALLYQLHPEWHALSTKEMCYASLPDAISFHSAFRGFVASQTEDKLERRELLSKVYTYKNKIRKVSGKSIYLTFDDWKNEFNSHPEWQGLSIKEFEEKYDASFIVGLQRWLLDNVSSKKKRREHVLSFFPRKPNTWRFNSIDEWKEYFNSHPEWRGNSTLDIQRTKEGTNFNMAFRTWCKKEADSDEQKRQELFRTIFPPKGRCTYQIGNEVLEFDSYPERLVGLMLLEIGLVDKFETGKNLHVRVSEKYKSKLDFLVNDVFIEYHPLHFMDIQKNTRLRMSLNVKNHI